MNASGRAGLIERLRENEARNRAVLARAGIAAGEAPTTECRACGAREITLFWTPGRCLGRSLYLSCPLCGEDTVRYRLDRNRVEHPRLLAALASAALVAALLLMVAAGVLYLRTTPAGSALLDDLRSHVERLFAPLTRRGAYSSSAEGAEPSATQRSRSRLLA